MGTDSESGRIASVERSLAVVDVIQELDGARVTEIADRLDLPPSTVHTHLKTLESNRYLITEGDEYHVGLEFLNRGGYARQRKPAYRMAPEIVENLAETTEERAQFIVEEHGRGIYLYTATGSHAVQVNARVGRVNYLHASAAGKAILAHLPDDRIGDTIDRWGLKPFTEHTLVDRDRLVEELEAIRDRKISFNDEESVEGLRAVGTPVRGPDERVIGALSVSGPTNRLKGEWFTDDIPDLLLGAANELELNVKYE